jgi:hypothetical protein
VISATLGARRERVVHGHLPVGVVAAQEQLEQFGQRPERAHGAHHAHHGGLPAAAAAQHGHALWVEHEHGHAGHQLTKVGHVHQRAIAHAPEPHQHAARLDEVVRRPRVLDDEPHVLVGQHEVTRLIGVQPTRVGRNGVGGQAPCAGLVGAGAQRLGVTLVAHREGDRPLARVAFGDGQRARAVTAATCK